MMPTHKELAQFLREYAKLTPEQQTLFLTAVRKMVEDLRTNRSFRPVLRVKGVRGHPGVFEMSWSGDGRATFHYGAPVQSGEAHIVWRRVGGHEIFQNP
jgi:hypothetical protein